jgi:hypothetical protein
LILGKAFVRAATLKSHHKKKEGTVIMMEWKILEAGNPMNKQENTPTNPFALGNSMGMAMYVAGTTNGNGDGAGGSGEGNMYFPKNFDHSPTFLVSESVSSPTYVSHQPIQPELENLSVGTVDMQNFDENASVDLHQLFPNQLLPPLPSPSPAYSSSLPSSRSGLYPSREHTDNIKSREQEQPTTVDYFGES